MWGREDVRLRFDQISDGKPEYARPFQPLADELPKLKRPEYIDFAVPAEPIDWHRNNKCLCLSKNKNARQSVADRRAAYPLSQLFGLSGMDCLVIQTLCKV